MKKLKLLLPALLLNLLANSQAGQINQINIISFTVKPVLPGTIDSWLSTPGALIMVAQKVPNPRMVEPRLVIQIRSGSAVICGNNAATAKQVDPFDVRTFSTADLIGFLSNCHELKAGTYTICAQFFNIDKVAISREVCKDFRVEDVNVEYAPPTLITPDNLKKFNAQELLGPVMFRWTPLVPKPKEPVTYRLKVWQLMEGQNGTMAMRTNQPIVTKDVDNLTQATVNGIYTGPCKPPYLCDFIWNVQALNRSGKPMGNNNGTSEPYTFGVAEEKTKGPDNVFPENNKTIIVPPSAPSGQGDISFKWSPITPKPSAPVTYRLKVWQLMQGQNGTQAMRSNPPIATKDVTDITQATVSNLYTGPCKPPYLCDYIWNVQVVTRDGTPGAESEPTTFKITEEKGKCPANVFPEDKKKFDVSQAKGAITFKWTRPVPGESHTYRLKVWQLMQGQNGTQAMISNQPIVTKDVDNLTEVTVSGIYTGPCKPPYLCDYIWMVEAVSKDGRTGCAGEPTTFSVTEENVKCPANLFPEDKKKFTPEEAKKEMMFRWTALVPKPQEQVTYRIKVWQLMQGQNSTQAMISNQPIVTKEVDDLTQVSVSGIYTGPCKPPYLCDYIWMVEAVSKDGRAYCAGKSTAFSVTEENVKCPANLFPEDKKIFTQEEAKKEMMFRWTAIVPKPQEPVTYRIKVWQLMQGQNGTQAMRSNPPIVTKDVDNLTQATVSGIYTGPCKPPYLCDYIWMVEVITKQAGATQKIICTSEPTMFAVNNCDVNLSLKLKSVECLKSENGFNIYRICVTSTYISPVYQLTYSNPGSGFSAYHPSYTPTYTVSNVTPVLQVQNTGPSTTVNYCVDVAVPIGQNAIKLGLQGDDKDPGPIVCQPGAELDINLPPCKCNFCDSVKINVVQKDLKFDASGNIILNTTISVSPKPVSSIKAELVYYEYKPESDDCMLCNKDSKTFGNFGTGNHSQEWNFTPPKNISNGEPASMIITVPPTVNCCDATIKWCIRYVVTFEDCTVCNKLVCYEIKKDGCANGNPNLKTGQK